MGNRTDGVPIAVTPDPSGYRPVRHPGPSLCGGGDPSPPPHGHIESR